MGIICHPMRMYLIQLVVLQYVKGRRKALNKEFERCCTFLAEMMEKYGALVMRDIAIEIQFEPDAWEFDAEGKRLRCEAYVKRLRKRFEKAA
jgi:hypothetical protein